MTICDECGRRGGYHLFSCSKRGANFSVSSMIAEQEKELCECDRPDERVNPHRHKLDFACIYWRAGRPSQDEIQKVLDTLP